METILKSIDQKLDTLLGSPVHIVGARPVVYLAGYIANGKNEKGEEILDLCQEWRNWFKAACPECRFIDPMDGEAMASLKQHGLISDLPARAILDKDYQSVSACNAVICNTNTFGGSRPLTGTMIELGWAHVLHKPILILSDESMYTKHPFINGMSSIVDHRKTEILRVLRQILTGL